MELKMYLNQPLRVISSRIEDSTVLNKKRIRDLFGQNLSSLKNACWRKILLTVKVLEKNLDSKVGLTREPATNDQSTYDKDN